MVHTIKSIYDISLVQCMQFMSSYDKECYNEHDVMYHYFSMIAWNILISYNIHTWCHHTTDNLWYFNIYYLNTLPNIKNVWYFSLFLFTFFCKQCSTNTFTPWQLPPPNIYNICSKTANICCHFAPDHIPDYIHFTIYHHQLHFQCSEAQASSAISPKT